MKQVDSVAEISVSRVLKENGYDVVDFFKGLTEEVQQFVLPVRHKGKPHVFTFRASLTGPGGAFARAIPISMTPISDLAEEREVDTPQAEK